MVGVANIVRACSIEPAVGLQLEKGTELQNDCVDYCVKIKVCTVIRLQLLDDAQL